MTTTLTCPTCASRAIPIVYGTPAPGLSRPQQAGLLRFGGMYTAQAPNVACTGSCEQPLFTVDSNTHAAAVAAAVTAVTG